MSMGLALLHIVSYIFIDNFQEGFVFNQCKEPKVWWPFGNIMFLLNVHLERHQISVIAIYLVTSIREETVQCEIISN